MKTINLKYTGNADLKDFIKSNNLIKEKNVFIQVFSGLFFKEIINNINSTLKEELPQSHIIGTSTNGEIINGSAIINSIIISFSFFENVELKSTYVDFNQEKKIKKNYNEVFNEIINDKTKLIIIFSDWLTPQTEEILENFHKFRPDIFISGGKAGDNLKYEDCFVFNEKGIIDRGFVAVSFSADKLFVNNLYNFCWLEIGLPLKITRSKDIVVYEINGEKAVDAYRRYLGKEIADNLDKYGVQYPLISEKNSHKIAKCPVMSNPDGSIILSGIIKEGETVKFGIGNMDHILNNAYLLFNAVVRYCPVESIFLYSSGSRRIVMGEDINSRIILFQSLATTVGFFGNT
ncbi:MAG: FIST N-terminal domain-containing protein, partial [Candidatus Gracilibacteria bacterium]|nr:FIST N-terminal domain-containing protein [Candidatus Gracilibacteria bacterium]